MLTLAQTVLRSPLACGETIEFQIRYRQEPLTATIASIEDATLTLKTTTPVDTPASGQSCVLYRGSECIGGGIIQ